MTYTITGVRSAPDVGFRSAHCHTAQGAQEVATSFLADGLKEIEVYDDSGRLRTYRDLRAIAAERGIEEQRAADRLRPLRS